MSHPSPAVPSLPPSVARAPAPPPSHPSHSKNPVNPVPPSHPVSPLSLLPNETTKAYAAFKCYLDLGPSRSVKAVAARLRKTKRTVDDWASRFQWVERIRRHEESLVLLDTGVQREVLAESAKVWAERRELHLRDEWDLRTRLLETAREALRRWEEDSTRCETLSGIARLLELASKLGRLASGLATDKTEIVGEDGGPLQIEFTRALDRVYGPAEAAARLDAAPPPAPLLPLVP